MSDQTPKRPLADPDPSAPVGRLKMRPNKSPQPLRFGAPWAYADTLVLDRRSRNLAPGSLAVLDDPEARPIALGAVNTASKIAFRVLDRDPGARLDDAWFGTRIARALALRETLYETPHYRLIHAEADGMPGVVIDRFGDTAVLQPNAAWAEARREMIARALVKVAGVTTVHVNAAGRARQLEGLDDAAVTLIGAAPATLSVPMNGAVYRADLAGGQKTGLFFDQRDNHAFAARLGRGRRVLDVFSHVGGFGLAALAGGAEMAVAIDGSAPALALAREGADLSGVAARFETRQGDAFALMDQARADGETYGLVVCDPPAFAPAKPALEAGLRAYERVARMGAALVGPGGYLVLCSCSHTADMDKFRAACLRGIGKGGRTAQILRAGAAGADHPVHPHLAESAYLKALFLRLD